MTPRAFCFKALCLGCLLIAGTGCDRILREAVHAVVEPVAEPALTRPNDEAVNRFVDAMQEAAQRGDADAINAFFDWDTVARRGAVGLPILTITLERVAKGAARGCKTSGVCASFASVGSGGAKIRHLGTRDLDRVRWTTFRVMPIDGGFEHVSFALSADEKGSARAVDIKLLTTGEATSATLRRALLPLASGDPEHITRRLTGTESAFMQHSPAIAKAQELATQGKALEALAIMDELPTALRRDPALLTQRVNIARLSGDDSRYLAAMDDLAQHHPNKTVVALTQIDAYMMRGRVPEALTAVESCARTIKFADPYVEVVRANLHLSAKSPREAIRAAKRAIAKEPDLIEAYWPWIQGALEQPDFPETTRALLALHAQGIEIDLQHAVYEAYSASPEHAKLQAALKEQARPAP